LARVSPVRGVGQRVRESGGRQVVIPAQAGWGGGGVRAVSEGDEGRFPHIWCGQERQREVGGAQFYSQKYRQKLPSTLMHKGGLSLESSI
jgi:hypothetical protein